MKRERERERQQLQQQHVWIDSWLAAVLEKGLLQPRYRLVLSSIITSRLTYIHSYCNREQFLTAAHPQFTIESNHFADMALVPHSSQWSFRCRTRCELNLTELWL